MAYSPTKGFKMKELRNTAILELYALESNLDNLKHNILRSNNGDDIYDDLEAIKNDIKWLELEATKLLDKMEGGE